MRKITIQDIAQALSLSRNTVAKALNDKDEVAAETRMAVILKAIEMGYKKLSPQIEEKYGKLLEEGNKRSVLLVARKETSSFWNKIIIGITDELNENNYRLLFDFINEEEEDSLTLPIGLKEDIAGIIILSVFSEAYIKALAQIKLPLVFLDAPADYSCVRNLGDIALFEGFTPIYRMTRHFLIKGKTKFAFIGDITYCRTMKERFLGFQKAVSETEDVTYVPVTHHVQGRYYIQEEVSGAVKSLPYLPEVMVCANDDIAKYVILYLREQGICVPGEVEVTGFDNTSSNVYMDISLTTVDIKKTYMGRRLARQILWRILNPDMPTELIYVETKPVWGQSAPY